MADNSTTTPVPAPLAAGGSLSDKLVGKVKAVTGTVLGDDQLTVEGRLQTAKADAADDAVELAQKAQARDAVADLATREQHLQAAQAAIAAQAREEAQTQAVDAAAAKETAQVERDAAKRAESAERTRKQREAAADRELFAAARERATAEKEADRLSAQARQEAARPLTPPVVAAAGVRGLPGRALVGYLNGVHRSIALLAGTLGKDESWVAMKALTALRAKIEQTAGFLVHDAALRNAGERVSDELSRREVAADLEARASRTRRQADAALAEAKRHTAANKKATAKATEAVTSAIASEATKDRNAATTEQAAAKARVRETAAVNAKVREVADRDRAKVALSQEAAALQAEHAALGKQDEVSELDRAVSQSKARRNRR